MDDATTGANVFPSNVFPQEKRASVFGIAVFEVAEEDGWVLVGSRRPVEGVRTKEDVGEGA